MWHLIQKIFDTEEECMRYESHKMGFKLFNLNGDVTDDITEASYIYCPNEAAYNILVDMQDEEKYKLMFTDDYKWDRFEYVNILAMG